MINKPFIRNQNRPVQHSENWTRLESVLRSNSSILLSQNCIQIFALRAGGGRHHDCPRFRLSSDTTWLFHTERIFCPLSDVHIFLCLSLWYSPSNVACTSLFQDTAPCLVSPPLSLPPPSLPLYNNSRDRVRARQPWAGQDGDLLFSLRDSAAPPSGGTVSHQHYQHFRPAVSGK